MPAVKDPERRRLQAMRGRSDNWRRWGPYVSERQWGTVREDYSEGGAAWDYFPHDHARSRAYRWGEDGLAGFCDNRQLLCLSLALWNGRDPILKERLFGLTNQQGNHGEDVKELYYYLDALPSHTYNRMLYKLLQAPYPYQWLIDENANRKATPSAREFELIDTGLFDEDRYFDVEIEYAKASPDDILMRITAHNRGHDTAPIWILPQAWFRNSWSWSDESARPEMSEQSPGEVSGNHDELGRFSLSFERPDRLAFCENDTNFPKVFGSAGPTGFCKDGVNDLIVHGREDAVCPEGRGTKVAGVYHRMVPAGRSAVVRVRLCAGAVAPPDFAGFNQVMTQRRQEADAFYAVLQADVADQDMRLVQRQALAGLAELWMGDQREGLDNLRNYYLQKVRQMGVLREGAARVTDKMPLNETHLGLIALLFPEAPLIHVLRHPLDIMVSAFSNQFTHGFFCAYDLKTAARHYVRVMDLVQHYRAEMTLRFLPIRYEDIVADQDASVRSMLAFIGEPFDDACLTFHQNRRYARTASYAQVTERLYDRSVYRYRHYRTQLEPVLPVLRPVIERLGYAVD
jgi:Sulfotransferase family